MRRVIEILFFGQKEIEFLKSVVQLVQKSL